MIWREGLEVRELEPIKLGKSDASVWAGAVWVGEIRTDELDVQRLELAGGVNFRRARFLVWEDDEARGFIELPITDGGVDVATVKAEIEELPPIRSRLAPWVRPPMSVVVCTKDNPDDLRDALEKIAALDYPEFEIVVVDNNPSSGLTPPVVAAVDSGSIRRVDAVGQGLSIARNVGVKNARHRIIAFTDDDVLVDRSWLTNLAYGFSVGDDVACVCGMAASAELATPSQVYFDKRVGWADCDSAVFELAAPPEDPIFPFRVAAYGTGANFAIRKDVVLALGGFDEGLGVGSPTGGGEDLDIFSRVLLADKQLVREPSAVVWHRHRRTIGELKIQIYNYGRGLGAWITKLLFRPKTLAMVLRRVRVGIRHLRGVTAVDQGEMDDSITVDQTALPDLKLLRRHELRGVLSAPWALARARIAGRAAAPLRMQSSAPMKMNFRRGHMWGDPGSKIAAGRLALTATALGLIGSVGAIPNLPSPVLGIAAAAFVFAGPGCLALSWYTTIPTEVRLPLIPIVSLAVCILVVAGLLMFGFYSPAVVLLGMTGVTAAVGLCRCGYLVWGRRDVDAT
ncbi:MAG: hypothetical protein QOK02_3770 [Mycobacterium sp.]|nr:hypothetical protein [Mycobacterium sp.]